jgi:hypothetical protein
MSSQIIFITLFNLVVVVGALWPPSKLLRECLHVFPTFHYYLLSINMKGVNKQLDVKLLPQTSWVSTRRCTQFCLNKKGFRHLWIARRHMQHPTKRLRSHYNIVNHPITNIQIQKLNYICEWHYWNNGFVTQSSYNGAHASHKRAFDLLSFWSHDN